MQALADYGPEAVRVPLSATFFALTWFPFVGAVTENGHAEEKELLRLVSDNAQETLTVAFIVDGRLL